MIYPTRRFVLLAAAVAPAALAIGVAAPAFWFAGLALLVFLLVLGGVDALLCAPARGAELFCTGPEAVSVGAPFEIEAHVRVAARAPAAVEVALEAGRLIAAPEGYGRIVPMDAGVGSAIFPFEASRRGIETFGRAWMRWRGTLGLVWMQRVFRLSQPVLITPDIRPVREKAVQLMHNDMAYGIAAQLQIGEGSEFEALADYRAGMDRRAIDWKQSARHTALLAKEYRTERNNHVVMAIDAGRAMCEPVAGLPRVDRAVSAALLTAYLALKDGDRVGFFGFDSHPRVASHVMAGQRNFALLQRVAAQIDYSPNETNYTLALSTLAARLRRRSLVIVFTDFTDAITAEQMLAAVGTLLDRHLVLFVVLRDEELEAFVATEPESPEDVTRAVTAAALLRQRRLVVSRLRHLGVHVIEAAPDQAGPAVVNRYLDFKRRGLL